jgi:hypothetical protein
MPPPVCPWIYLQQTDRREKLCPKPESQTNRFSQERDRPNKAFTNRDRDFLGDAKGISVAFLTSQNHG